LLADEKQQLLFTEGAEQAAAEKPEEIQSIRSFTRKKDGRKPLSPNLKRRQKTINIPESKKTCD
jgi:hypothetical protein